MAKSRAKARSPTKAQPRSPQVVRRKPANRAKKISLTVNESVLHEVERDARRAGRSLSAYVSEALARDMRQQRLQALIDEYEAEHGVITGQELDAIRDKWQG
jgi:hypothetical protein